MAKLQKKKTVSNKKKQAPVQVQSDVESSQVAVQNIDIDNVVAKKSKIASTSVKRDGNFIFKSINYFKEVVAELKKVIWPPKRQTMLSTVIVIILVIVISIFLGLNDFLLSSLIKFVL